MDCTENMCFKHHIFHEMMKHARKEVEGCGMIMSLLLFMTGQIDIRSFVCDVKSHASPIMFMVTFIVISQS